MTRSTRRILLSLAFAATTASVVVPLLAQQGGTMTQEQRDVRWEREKELQSLAVVERKVMMPMRDGVRLATDIYRPKNAAGKVPIVFVKTPYNFNYWDVRNGVPSDMNAALTAIKRGYAYVVQNERGHFFSEGNYDILGPPATDGYDAMEWLSKQNWSNGKVGTTGCSSTAEYQPAVAAQGHPAFAAMNVQGFGAGVGRVGPYYEQGNWYRGGAVQMLFITWIYGQQNQVRPMFPKDTSQADLVQAARLFDLAPQNAAGRLGQGARAPAGAGHHQRTSTARAASSPTRCRSRPAGDDPAHAQRSRLVQGRPLARQHEAQDPGPLVYVLVRRLGRPQHRDVQPRAKTAPKAIADQQWMIIAPGRALRLHPRHREHRRRRAQHG